MGNFFLVVIYLIEVSLAIRSAALTFSQNHTLPTTSLNAMQPNFEERCTSSTSWLGSASADQLSKHCQAAWQIMLQTDIKTYSNIEFEFRNFRTTRVHSDLPSMLTPRRYIYRA